jgi:hypothetical protein
VTLRRAPVGVVVLLAVVLAGAGCSTPTLSPATSSAEVSPSATAPAVSASPSPGISASPTATGGVVITFEDVKSKRWGAKPFKVKAVASNDAKLKYSANGGCKVRSGSGLVTINEVGDCVITAKTTEGESASGSTTITVRPAKTKLTFVDRSPRYERPFAYTLKAKVSPQIPLKYTLVEAGSGEECKVSDGKLTLTDVKPSLEATCKVKVTAAKTSPNYEAPKPVVATIKVRYPSWDVDASGANVVYEWTDPGEVRVTIRERSGDALGISVGQIEGDGNCDVVKISPSDPAPPGTTKYVVRISVPNPADTGSPGGYECGMQVNALPPDYSCCAGGTTSDRFTVKVDP